MLRVALVGDYPVDPTRIWGGVEAAFTYLVKELCRLEQLELHILTLSNSAGATAKPIERNGATLHILPQFPRFEFARNFGTYQSMLNRKLDQLKPNLIHAQGATDHAYVALRSGYPTVITVHGVQSEDSKHQGTWLKRARKRLYGRLIERYNLSHTHHLIAIGHYVSKYFAKILRPGVHVYYVPNAIDDRFFNLPGRSKGQTILFAGRIIRRKRPLDLVRAFASIAQWVPSAQLRLAGEYETEPDYAGAVRQFIRAERLEDRVQLLGGLSEEAIAYEFAECEVLALPSVQETTPMVIAQAMAAGKPVIATPVGGIPEMVREGETGFLIPVADVDALAEKLLCLLRNPALRAYMGNLARDFARENYQATTVARRTYDVYRKVAASQ